MEQPIIFIFQSFCYATIFTGAHQWYNLTILFCMTIIDNIGAGYEGLKK